MVTNVVRRYDDVPLAASLRNEGQPLRLRFNERLILWQVANVHLIRHARRVLASGWQAQDNVFYPPVCRIIVVNDEVACFPVGLESVVVCPAVVGPRRRVYVRVVVVLGATYVASVQVVFLITMSAGEEGARLRPQLALTRDFIGFLCRRVRIIATPVNFVAMSTAVLHGASVVEGVLTQIKVEVGVVVRVGNVRVVANGGVTRGLTGMFAIFKRDQVGVGLADVVRRAFQVLVVQVGK